MKRRLPLALVLIFGIWGILTYFLPHSVPQEIDSLFRNNTLRIMVVFALILGLSSLIRYHTERIRRRREY